MPTVFEERAFFWRPGDNVKILGLLKADETGIEVDLDSTFQTIGALVRVAAGYPVIHGVTLAGGRFTLFGLVQTGAHASMHGPARESLWVREAVIGAYLAEGAVFEEMRARFDHLPEFVARSGITTAMTGGTLTIAHTRPDAITAETEQGQISVEFERRLEREPHREGVVEQIWLVCRPPAPKLLSEIADRLLFPARELISFATGLPEVIEEISVRLPAADRSAGSPTDLKFFHRYLQPDPTVRVRERAQAWDMVFSIADWPGDFAVLTTVWLLLKQRTTATIGAIFGLAYAPPRWGDTTAMIWAQALETYHRDCFAGGPASQEAADRHARVLAASPAGDRQWLQWKLEHADEPSLRRRIKDIARRAKPIVWPLLLKVPGFALRLSNARNAYAHFGIGTSDTVSAIDLYGISQVARWVLTANILLDLGFTQDEAKNLLQRNKEYYHMAFEDWP